MSGRTTSAAAVLAATSACMSNLPVYAGGGVGEQQVVIVGRIELVPPLGLEDQSVVGTNTIATVDYENQVYFITDNHYRDVGPAPEAGEFNGGLKAALGKPFHVTAPDTPLYVLRGGIFMKTGQINEIAYLPAGFVVNVSPADSAVCVGTLRYTRNEFMDILRVEVIDDCAQLGAWFAQSIDPKLALTTRLPQPI
jgi:hypothetical protein